MEARELRIGNYVNEIATGQCKVNIYLISFVEQANIINHQTDRYAGIPLTPEWLERFGFFLSDRTDNAIVHNETGFPIWHNDETNSYYHINSETLTHLDFIHQLQNLYFAVLNEELELKS